MTRRPSKVVEAARALGETKPPPKPRKPRKKAAKKAKSDASAG